jgi:hypothetical protein
MGFKSAMIMTPHVKGKKSVNHVTSLGVLAAMLTNGIQVLTNRTIGKNGEAENVTGGILWLIIPESNHHFFASRICFVVLVPEPFIHSTSEKPLRPFTCPFLELAVTIQ